MLKDGTYAAWYKTPLDQGTGIVHVADGQIWGCDSLMTYHGTNTYLIETGDGFVVLDPGPDDGLVTFAAC